MQRLSLQLLDPARVTPCSISFIKQKMLDAQKDEVGPAHYYTLHLA